MKKLPFILSIISLAGVVVLTVLFFTSGKGKTSGEDKVSDSSASGELKIAYIQTDSVLVSYQLAIDLHNDFMNKQQQYNSDFNKKQKDFEDQASAFQEKVQRGGFLTEERALKERDRIMVMQDDIKQMNYDLSSKLSQMEAAINQRLADSIINYVKVYNQKHHYSYILSNTGNIVIGDSRHNITKEIIDGLNARYVSGKK